MEQQRKEATERLLSSQGHDNLFYSEENVGVGDGGLVAVSNFTSILGLSILTAACITFGFGCAIGYSSPTQSSIMEDLGLSVAEFSLFGSILSIGSLIGAAISGKITDLFGRKLTMWILNLFYIGGWLAIAFTRAPWLLNLGRISLGFTNGISGYLAPIYIAEITTKHVRGRFTTILQVMVGSGASFMYVVGSFVHWRTLALLATIPGLLQLLLIFFIPESPRWLANVGREKELEAALLCLRGDKADISDEATEIKNHVESLKSFSRGGIVVDIFQKKYVRPLLTVVGMMVLTNLGGINAFVYYSGAIFVSAGISSMVGLITLAATQTVVGILSSTIIDKLGRRPLLLVSSAGLCFSSFLTGVTFFLKDFNWWDQGSPILAFIGLLMYMGSYALSAGLPGLLVSELFPINIKGSAGSICNFMGNSTGWVVGYYFNFLTEWSSAGIFFTFSAFCCANFILIATMVPETKGRTLEEIQASITPSSD
ncbi:sugar transporter ERD6-like 15 isoform X1 [Gossypium arboreum]|uniref:sugar transporter ERD6-like 15 isoform X1 n=1 Tax=Gossypium arboreum TaxID=29729 RepID=UPI0022F1A273|nr:sugar transporter ERD6-like 15 isoform X1 [Gossypium arboreum]